MMKNKQSSATLKHSVLLAVIALGLLGCSDNTPTNSQTKANTLVEVKGTAIATVNGEAITEEDVAFTIERTFSEADLMLINDGIKQKVLDSLVASRSMKQSMIKALSSDEQQVLKQKVKAYKEELYVKEYLVRNAVPVPVSAEMVKAFYDNNPQRFGGVELKRFEIIKSTTVLDESARNELLSHLATLKTEPDWKTKAAQLKPKYGLVYQSAEARKGLLNKHLEKLISSLDVGQVSDVSFINGNLIVIRVIDVSQLAPKPLSEVSAGIRKTLAPMQLKKAVKKASQEAIAGAEVVYLNSDQ